MRGRTDFYELGPFGEVTEGHFDKIFNTNVRGRLFTVLKALPLLSSAASVILTGSIASAKGFPPLGVYNASKAAVRSFARTWIVDLKERGIRVNVLSPGHIDTPGLARLLDQDAREAALWADSARPMTWARLRLFSLPTKAATLTE
jgi:NAD(P)-dependent dehydrogenase (short-subunit alcohol dehydrogenase family)